MLFKEINKKEFDELAPKMFSILSSNMNIIHSEEVLLDDNFFVWFKYHREQFLKKVFIIFDIVQ